MTFGRNNCSILPSGPQNQKYLLSIPSQKKFANPWPIYYLSAVTLYTFIAFVIHKLPYLILSIPLNNKFKDKFCDFYTVVYPAQNIAPKM